MYTPNCTVFLFVRFLNTIVLKPTVLGPVDQADAGCLTTEAVPFSQHRACQVGPVPQALDNVWRNTIVINQPLSQTVGESQRNVENWLQ